MLSVFASSKHLMNTASPCRSLWPVPLFHPAFGINAHNLIMMRLCISEIMEADCQVNDFNYRQQSEHLLPTNNCAMVTTRLFHNRPTEMWISSPPPTRYRAAIATRLFATDSFPRPCSRPMITQVGGGSNMSSVSDAQLVFGMHLHGLVRDRLHDLLRLV